LVPFSQQQQQQNVFAPQRSVAPTAFVVELRATLQKVLAEYQQLEERLKAITAEKENIERAMYTAQVSANAFKSTLSAYERLASSVP
jgi:hypothetical protein